MKDVMDYKYFKDEVKDGFFVSSMMKRVWAVSKKSLDVLSLEAKREGGNVLAAFGTLIGAVRNGGYIPWDDDLDMEMLCTPYNRIKEKSDAGLLPETYKILDYTMNHEDNDVRKWVDCPTIIRDQKAWKDSFGFPYYSTVDIFLVNNVPDDSELYFQVIKNLIYLKTQLQNDNSNNNDCKKRFDWLRAEIGIRFDFSKPKEEIVIDMLKACDDYLSRFEDGKRMMLSAYYVRDNNLIYDRKLRDNTIEMKFENGVISVPAGYDRILRSIYGNYMQIPTEMHSLHEYPIYKKDEEKLKELFDIELYKYVYDKNKVLEDKKSGENIHRQGRIQVVFLSSGPDEWKSLHSIWEAASSEENIDVSVIAVPYFYRGFDGKIINEIHIDSEGYPECVELTPFNSFDTDRWQPDVIFFQNPYDGFSDAMTVHPFFYAENLVKHTKNLVFVPAFTLREIKEKDNRSRSAIRSYVQSPGMVYADKIIVQSDNMKDVFSDMLKGFIDDIEWEEKILGIGSAEYDWDKRSRVLFEAENDTHVIIGKDGDAAKATIYDKAYRIPYNWIDFIRKNRNKRFIMYHVSGSMIFGAGEGVFNKVNYALEVFKKYQDQLNIIFLEDKYARQILENSEPELYKKYCALINRCMLDEQFLVCSSDYASAGVALCDGFYGDGCKEMNDCRMAGKPALFENPDLIKDREEPGKRFWNESLTVESEGDWTLESFIQAILSYELPVYNDDNGKRIWTCVSKCIDRNSTDGVESSWEIEIPELTESEYFHDEVRDGFFVPSMTKKSWALGYKNTVALQKICDSAGVTNFIMWGTLIGAIRHGGFIPWDDDLDTVMTRKDYNVLKNMDRTGRLPGEYWISDYEYNHDSNMTRNWVDSKSLIRSMESQEKNYGFPMYDPIDIFILDTIPDDAQEEKLFGLIIGTCAAMAMQAKDLSYQKEHGLDGVKKEDIVDEERFIKDLKKLSKILGHDIPLESDEPLFVRLFKELDEYCSNMNENVGRLVSTLTHYTDKTAFRIDKKLYKAFIEVPFEYGSAKVPIGYDTILRKGYGTYMYPYMGGGLHEYPFYKDFEGQMKELANVEFYTYHFNEEEYNSVMDSRPVKTTIRQEIENGVLLLQEAHEYLKNKILSGEIDDELADVLGQCQELAVGLGERIESRAINADEYVKTYELYCEKVFGLYQIITSESEVDTNSAVKLCNEMAEFESEFASEGKLIKERIKVVILVYRSSHWKTLHSIWEELNDDNNVDLKVIRVPYYLKKYDGSMDRDNMIIENGYPDEVEFVDYDKYDFENELPDHIIYQFPYDEFNESISLHPFYYSKNLCKYTGDMVFIPPFVTKEIAPDTEKLKKTLSIFLETPGIIYADKIIAQSEAMKEAYTEMLAEFTDGKQDMEGKIKGTGSAEYDWQSRGKTLIKPVEEDVYYDHDMNSLTPTIYDTVAEIPGEWMSKLYDENKKRKKVLLLFIGGSVLYDHGKAVIDKFRKAIDIIREHKDVVILWHMDKYAREILKTHNKIAWNELRKLRDTFLSEDMGILDESWDDDRAVDISDIFYGDACVMLNSMRERKKPVLWELPEVSLEAENDYNEKEWNRDTVMAIEGEWRLENFLCVAIAYRVPITEDGNGKRICKEIFSTK